MILVTLIPSLMQLNTSQSNSLNGAMTPPSPGNQNGHNTAQVTNVTLGNVSPLSLSDTLLGSTVILTGNYRGSSQALVKI